MSMQLARAFADRINMNEVMLAPHYSGLAADLEQLRDADVGLEEATAEAGAVNMLSAYGYGPTTGDERKPFAYADGVAIIPVHGTLINRFSWSWSYVTGYNFIRAQMQAALADDDVKLIIYDVNSYGGEAAGCFELCDDIYLSRAIKPSIAVIDSNCYSAGYAVASSAGKVYLTPSGGAGSIGVYVMHIDVSKMMEKIGYTITFIQSGAEKTDGNPYEKLPAKVKAKIQANVDQSREVFATLVSRNRGIAVEDVMGTEGAVYRSNEALELGLIDAVLPPSQVVDAYFNDELSGSEDDQSQENVMTVSTTTAPEAAAPAAAAAAPAVAAAPAANPNDTAAAGAMAEKARISAILTSEEGKSNAALANHLALSTALSVDDAKATLKAAGPAQAAATTPAVNPLAAAMAATGGGPNVGADDGTVEEQAAANGGQSAAKRILASQAKATGVKSK